MISGVLYALLAGLMWGLIFVGPLIVPDYPALLQSMGRYLAQALVTLPVSLIGYAAVCLWLSIQKPLFTLPFGPHPALFIGLMIAIAVLCSWVGALCWNIASQKLPTVILGPLIVFETLAGLLYTFILRQEIPPFLTLSGIALLVAGVVIAVRAKPEKATVVPVTER
ncbi:TPA: DMT family transporter [Salmonella enterica subsp. enterica serovar Concord]|nr:DMT family transporter [Salmonella enterica subsp. enterica serovar Concord]